MRIFFDTSGLPRNLAKPGQAFDLLEELADANLVDVFVPELVERERASQLLVELRETAEALGKLLKGSGAAIEDVEQGMQDAWQALMHYEWKGMEDKARTMLSEYLDRFSVTRVASEPDDVSKVWDGYFSGGPPFSRVKERRDIPDAFIFATAKRVAESGGGLHCVVADEGLRNAVGDLPGCKVYTNLKALVTGTEGEKLLAKLDWSSLWEQELSAVAGDIAYSDEAFLTVVDEGVAELLPGCSVDGVPAAGGNVYGVTPVDAGAYTIDWGKAHSMGPGWMSVPYDGSVECEVSYCVHWGDVSGLPDWVRVTPGDIETDKVFDATAVMNMSVTGELFVRMTRLQYENHDWKDATVEVELSDAVVDEPL